MFLDKVKFCISRESQLQSDCGEPPAPQKMEVIVDVGRRLDTKNEFLETIKKNKKVKKGEVICHHQRRHKNIYLSPPKVLMKIRHENFFLKLEKY